MFEPSIPTKRLFLDIRPKLFSQIADKIEPECHGTLDKPQARCIEPVRVPHVREKGCAVSASDAPCGQRFTAAIGAREHRSTQRTSRPAPETLAARSKVSRVLMQRRVQTESQSAVDP